MCTLIWINATTKRSMAARTADDAQLDESLGSVLIRRRVQQRTASLIMNVASIV